MRNYNSILNKLIVVILVISFVFISLDSYALEGWHSVGDYMTYLNKNGQMVNNTWKESDGMKFFLDEEGHVLYNKVFEYNGEIYFVNKQGAKVSNYFLDATEEHIVGNNIRPGTFYFDDSGRAFRRSDKSFLKVIDGKKYAFDEEGHMIKDSWISKDGDVIDTSSDIINDGCYRANIYGVLLQNQWYYFSDDVGADAGLPDNSNYNVDYYDEMNGLWMYFDNNCKKTSSSSDSMKKFRFQGKEYTFDQYGIMIQGFTKNQEEADTNQKSNPVISEKISYYDRVTGELLSNRWIKEETPDTFDDSVTDDEYWFYVNSDGSIVKNRLIEIDNKKYAFDGFGRLRQGFLLVSGKAFFVAEYKSEDLTKNDFIFSVAEGGRLYGSDLSDIYYFNEDGDNGGYMTTGPVKLELSDGEYEFNFRNNGRAIGNRNALKYYKGAYYRNGLKLIPWEETKYGIVKVSNDEYRVINSSGKTINAKKRVLIDDYGNFMVIINNKLAGYILESNRRVKLRWKTINGVSGFYYYDLDLAKKGYTGLCVESGTTVPTAEMIKNIPDDLKVNFK